MEDFGVWSDDLIYRFSCHSFSLLLVRLSNVLDDPRNLFSFFLFFFFPFLFFVTICYPAVYLVDTRDNSRVRDLFWEEECDLALSILLFPVVIPPLETVCAKLPLGWKLGVFSV